MSIFGKIASAIFGTAKSVSNALSGAATAVESAIVDAGKKKPEPMTREQVDELIQKIANDGGYKDYNWKQSIVDLMKLLKLDSSLASRKELA